MTRSGFLQHRRSPDQCAFRADRVGQAGRGAQLQVRQSGQSNLRELGAHKPLAERLLRAWRVSEPTALELALAA